MGSETDKSKELKFYGGDPRLLPLYSVGEVSHHLGLASSTVRSWVKDRGEPKPFERVVIPADGKGSMLSFQNLIEIHVLSSLRGYDIPLPKVRDAIGYLRLTFDTEHPLADIELHTDRNDIFVRYLGGLVSLTTHGQVAIEPVVERYLQRIERSDGVLARLYPFVGPEVAARPVAIDPLRKFGRPYLVGVGVETVSIANRFHGGDSVEDLALDYGATPELILHALRFEGIECSVAA